jgi:hypothetical protein
MRNNRQLSPSQTALWTAYELIDAQAARLRWHSQPTPRVRSADIGAIGHVLALVMTRLVLQSRRSARNAICWFRARLLLTAAGSVP